jgi:hypothetical protein
MADTTTDGLIGPETDLGATWRQNLELLESTPFADDIKESPVPKDLDGTPSSDVADHSSPSSEKGGPSIPAIAGGVVGALVLLAAVGLVCFCVGKKGRDRWNGTNAGGVQVGSGRDENWVQVMGLDPPPLVAAEPDIPPVAVGGEGDGLEWRIPETWLDGTRRTSKND